MVTSSRATEGTTVRGMQGGLLFVDKPQGMTSHDVVDAVRRAARTRRVGHAGTLDPFATGLLVLAVGPATRLLPYIVGEPKVYRAEIAFGSETDTDDSTGSIVRNGPLPDFNRLQEALASLTGTIEQVPPAFSAKHINGKRAYELARKGHDVSLRPIQVAVHEWFELERTASSVTVRVTCSGGTYVRALARDLGRALQSAAHCASLRRLASGSVHVDMAIVHELLTPGSIATGEVPLVNPLVALGEITRVLVSGEDIEHLRHGRLIAHYSGESPAVFLDAHDNVLGIGERVTLSDGATAWQPRVVLGDLLTSGATT